MNKNTVFKNARNRVVIFGVVTTFFLLGSLLSNSPVLAHHPNGGQIPSTFAQGFLSGLGHPVIGIDHLVFVLAIGFLAALCDKLGMVIPLAFVVTTAIGTGIHLQSFNLPVVEGIIAASVLLMGIFLARKNQTNLLFLTAISAIAGVFHGYAYGESIVGAEITALSAYLFGFCLIQLCISAISFYIGKLIINRPIKSPRLVLRFIGFVLCGIGFTFLSNAILG